MEGETYYPPTAEEQAERARLPRQLLLDSIQVSRESIGTFTKLLEGETPNRELIEETIFMEQDNIRQEFDKLRELVRGEHE